MEKQNTIRQATELWINRDFNEVPGILFEELTKSDESVSYYDSGLFRLVASPRVECLHCGTTYEGELVLQELHNAFDKGNHVPCEYCTENSGNCWGAGRPKYAFPCGWGTLFSPKNGLDQQWIGENSDDIATLGFFVFESDIYGYLLGIDAGGFDFYQVFWIPLYRLRGLQWHNSAI